MRPRTRAVHAGAVPPSPGDARLSAPSIEQASAALFANLDDLEAAYADQGAFYRPYGSSNPNQLQTALAELEGAGADRDVAGLVTASGMSAIHLAALLYLKPGQKLVAASDLYGGTVALFDRELPAMGIDAQLVELSDHSALHAALEGASLLVIESISNPAMRVADIDAIATLAHAAGVALLVDNTFATPVLCRPLEHGADAVAHSLTKYISGHGDAVGGALIYGAELEPRLRQLATTFRPTASPLDSWLALRGLRTLSLRVEAASASALQMAGWLQQQQAVSAVHYPGLATHPTHDVARRVLSGGFGGMLSFELAGGAAAVAEAVRRLKLITLMPSLADVATTLSYPVATSHRGFTAEQLKAAGVSDAMLRLSVGIEDARDLQDDLDQALRGL